LADETITDIRAEVQKLNTEVLRSALLTDRGEEGGTAHLLSQLEAKTGVSVQVKAQRDYEILADTRIIGAALNDVPQGVDKITLNIGAPEREHVIPEQYNNTVALSFSLGLDGVTDEEALKVPVKVILPIPEKIDPEFLVLLHYGLNGDVEEIVPYVFREGGRWYASFVLTSFSDFMLVDSYVGTTEVFLDGNRAPGVRTMETNLGDLVADATLWQAKQSFPEVGADIAIVNGGSIRSSLEVGKLSCLDIQHVAPFETPIVILSVTGQELLELLESAMGNEEEHKTGFPQVAGLSFVVDKTAPYEKGAQYPGTEYFAPAAPGKRVKNVTVGGQPLDLAASYTLATNDFVAGGGDTYCVLRGKSYAETYVNTRDAIVLYIRDELQGTVTEAQYGKPAGRIAFQTEAEKEPDDSHQGGGASGGTSTPTYEVKHPAETVNGTVTITPKKAERGETVQILPKPDDGYRVAKVTVTDRKGNELEVREKEGEYHFVMPASQVEIHVEFEPIPEEVLPPITEVFADVPEGAWYSDSVAYVYERGMMTGTGERTFSPELTASRGMLVTTLYRLAGEPESPSVALTDVAAGQWYSDSITWAVNSGIAGGYGDGSFGPDDPVTREQLVTILYRYAGWRGDDVAKRADLSAYSDVDTISPYGVDALSWAVAEGLVRGTGESQLSPKCTATRAEIATILMRFCQTME